MKMVLSLIAGIALVSPSQAAPNEKAVLTHYADLAHTMYQDSLITARALKKTVNELIARPTEANLAVAKSAWKNARIPYQQTEAYRFGNAIVDDWEGKVNAWPLDEGLIDYVAANYGEESDENPFYSANIIAPILERIGLNSDAWLKSVTHYSRNYFSVLGSIDRIKAFAEEQKKRWHRGQRAVLNSYRLAMGQGLNQCNPGKG